MLMLTRNVGKAIVIGGNIRVMVSAVTGQQVRLGIVAPAGVVVDREEIHERRVSEGAEQEPAFSVDEHVKLVADARRYRWLRERDGVEQADDMKVVRDTYFLIGEELDREIDTALRLDALTAVQQKVDQGQQP